MGELRKAISCDEIEVFYQPKIELHTEQVYGFESLAHWQHPSRGLLAASEFVPVAERGRLSTPLLLRIHNQSSKRWAEWAAKGWNFSISVNLSVLDLVDPDLPGSIVTILKQYNMPPDRLVLEITNSTLMKDQRRTRETMLALSEMNVCLSIDEFGVGCSSLSHLKNSPVKEMKIHQSFVANMAEGTDDLAIVKSTIELGHTLGLKVAADDVECANHFELLKQIGCDAAQGSFICAPKPPKEIEDWIRTKPWPAPL